MTYPSTYPDPELRPWRPAQLGGRPVWRVCRFSGCGEPYARTVEHRGVPFDLCDGHASRLEAAAQ